MSKFSRALLFCCVAAVAAALLLRQSEISRIRPVSEQSDETIYIKVTGCVKKPGVVTLKNGATAADAVAAAGGTTEVAGDYDATVHLQSGDVLNIPSAEVTGIEQINLNHATAEELATLHGIGEKTAEAIIDYREQNGSFRSTDELMLVSGIGEKSYQALAPFITVD